MLFVGSFLNGTAFPMIVGIAGCAAVALALAQTTLRSREADNSVVSRRRRMNASIREAHLRRSR